MHELKYTSGIKLTLHRILSLMFDKHNYSGIQIANGELHTKIDKNSLKNDRRISIINNENQKAPFTSENAHARTMCLCSNECNSSPLNASHTLLQKGKNTRQQIYIRYQNLTFRHYVAWIHIHTSEIQAIRNIQTATTGA